MAPWGNLLGCFRTTTPSFPRGATRQQVSGRFVGDLGVLARDAFAGRDRRSNRQAVFPQAVRSAAEISGEPRFLHKRYGSSSLAPLSAFIGVDRRPILVSLDRILALMPASPAFFAPKARSRKAASGLSARLADTRCGAPIQDGRTRVVMDSERTVTQSRKARQEHLSRPSKARAPVIACRTKATATRRFSSMATPGRLQPAFSRLFQTNAESRRRRCSSV
jgi:hypothetical protein